MLSIGAKGGGGVTKISKPQQGEGRIFVAETFSPLAPPWHGLGQLTCPQRRHSREMKIYSGGPGWGWGGGAAKAQEQIRPLLSLAAP